MPWSFEIPMYDTLYSLLCTLYSVSIDILFPIPWSFKCIPTDQTKYHCSCDKLKVMIDRLTVNWVPGGGLTFRSDCLEMLGKEDWSLGRLIILLVKCRVARLINIPCRRAPNTPRDARLYDI